VRRSTSFRRRVRAGLLFIVMPGLIAGVWAQPAFAGTSSLNLVVNCVEGYGWYGVYNTSKVQTPGNAGTRVTVSGYATAEVFDSQDCLGSYSTTTLAGCFTSVDPILYRDDVYFTDQYESTTTGGVHQLPSSYNAQPSSGTFWVNTVVTTDWGSDCGNQGVADNVSGFESG